MAADKISGIYEIVNTVNGKRYIGSSVNIKTRWSQHRVRLSGGDHHCPPLQRAWVKYGSDAFEFRVIERCGRDVLVSLEQSYLDRRTPEYNVAKAAGYRTFLGLTHSPETISKMSDAHKGNTRTKGKKRCREAVEATAAAHRGMKRSPGTRAKMSAAKSGKKCAPRSQEHRDNIGKAHKGRQKSPEHMAALQAGRASRVYTTEQRAAISAASKAAWAKRKAQNSK